MDKTTEKLITKRLYHCPSCDKAIPEGLAGQAGAAAPCPHCKAPVRLPASIKKDVRVRDERIDKRYRATLRVAYQSFDEFKSEYTRNVSRGGMFISTHSMIPMGTRIELHLYVPNLPEPLRILGEVAHKKEPNERGEGGLGIKFIEIDEASKIHLVRYLSRIKGCI